MERFTWNGRGPEPRGAWRTVERPSGGSASARGGRHGAFHVERSRTGTARRAGCRTAGRGRGRSAVRAVGASQVERSEGGMEVLARGRTVDGVGAPAGRRRHGRFTWNGRGSEARSGGDGRWSIGRGGADGTFHVERSRTGIAQGSDESWRRRGWHGTFHVERSRSASPGVGRRSRVGAWDVSRGTVEDRNLDQGPLAVQVDLAAGLLGQGGRRRQHEDAAAGAHQPPAERQPLLGGQRRPRDRDVEARPGRSAASFSPRVAASSTRPASPSSRIAVRRNAPFLAIGSQSRIDSCGRMRARGKAGRPPPLPTSTRRAGWSSCRASAKASGK